MTPRSWKPDVSLAENVTDSQAQQHIDDISASVDHMAAAHADDVSATLDPELAAEIALVNLQGLQRTVMPR